MKAMMSSTAGALNSHAVTDSEPNLGFDPGGPEAVPLPVRSVIAVIVGFPSPLVWRIRNEARSPARAPHHIRSGYSA